MTLTVGASVRVARAMAPLVLAATAAEEGKKVIEAMLVVGLVFAGVITLGQLTHWLRHRRRY